MLIIGLVIVSLNSIIIYSNALNKKDPVWSLNNTDIDQILLNSVP